jgi:hypothetical protein
MKDFRDLRVWHEAHHLTLKIYRATSRFPREELYGLTSQIRRCTVSIGANIAEGCGKGGNNEFQRFLVIASDQRVSWITNSSWRRTWSTWTNPPITPCMKIFPGSEEC